jgi:hypothetical protein
MAGIGTLWLKSIGLERQGLADSDKPWMNGKKAQA